MSTITIGVDLAKDVFAVCVLDGTGRVVQRRDFRREAFAAWLAQQAPGTVIAMEACSGAHHWARRCVEHGLQARLLAAQFVVPYRKSRSTKNDQNDAEAIATAARQGNMRFVPVKSVEQQARLSWHRVREGYKAEGLAIGNRIRGLLAEFGVVVNRSDAALRRAISDADLRAGLPAGVVSLIDDLAAHRSEVMARQAVCDQRIVGIGPISADALVATVGNGREFKNGRQLAAWLGLTPTQHSSGGKRRLGSISCRGDAYLRTLLIQGARSSVQRAKTTPHAAASPEQRWIQSLVVRLPFGKVLAAVANKHARQCWAMLARDEDYDADAWLRHPMVQRAARAG
jgi:transposase